MLLNRSAHLLAALILCGFFLSASLVASNQSARVEDIANIDFRLDSRIFTVMAALNVAGFDYEAPGREMAEVRVRIRRELEAIDPELRDALQQYFSSHAFSDAVSTHTAYTSLALVIGPPPKFEVQEDGPRLPADVSQILDFSGLLAQFYERANIGQLWQEYSSQYASELQSYRPVVRQVIRDTLDYFMIPARIVLDRQIVLIPDLLGYQDVVHARNLERVYYIVLGPAEDPSSNYEQLQHEYLHFLIDPLVEKHGGIILATQDLLPLAQQQPELSPDFQNQYLLIVGESLIEAVLWKLRPPENRDSAMVSLFRKGLIFVPYFLSALEEFEKIGTRPLPVHLEDIFAGISEKEIESDLKRIAALETTQRKEQQRQQEILLQEKADYERREKMRELLNSATSSMRAQDYTTAKNNLSELLQMDEDNPHALFYLGQIAAQEGSYQEAFEYYQRVSGRADIEPWIQATAIVRMGKYLAYQELFEEARQQFEKVLSLQGDLKGARQEAEASLRQLEKQRN